LIKGALVERSTVREQAMAEYSVLTGRGLRRPTQV